jgi:tRNA dimethylallyltransferase
MENKKKLIIVAGPTASGKTAVSIALAKKINGEIISADSMQVYKYMDIGSAKVTQEQMKGVAHHLVDLLEPDEDFSVHRFQTMAKEAMTEIYSKNAVPIIAGGTGFYIQSVVYDIDFSSTDEEKQVRQKVMDYSSLHGEEALFQWLKEIDPESCETIHPNNIKRVQRALEYYLLTGEKMSVHNAREKSKTSPYELTFVVLTMEREVLYERINRRVDQMIEEGLLDEVKALMQKGYTKEMTSMQGLGYKEVFDYLNGECSLDEAIYKIKRDTRHFAKRQLTWFRRENNVHWIHVDQYHFDIDAITEAIIKLMEE